MASTKSGPESRRLLWTVLGLVVLAAVCLWSASTVTWAEVPYTTPFSGEGTSTIDGARLRPELGPLALVVLAAAAAVLASRGVLRRSVGLVLAVIGALLCWRAALVEFAWSSELPPGGEPTGAVAINPPGPLLTAVGGVALVAAGLLVTFRARRLPGMGSRYSAPGAAKERPRDPDRQLWDALDADQDPTDDGLRR